jgi:two-component system phosphate regulon sensor histidine kinase PhoR
MKKRLFIIFVFLTVITLIITSVLSTLVYYEFYKANTKEQLKTIVKLSSDNGDWDNYDNIHKTVNTILKSVNYKIRISLIDINGNVIYDNLTNYEKMENHKDRPEVVEAFNNGEGENIRYSDTLKLNTFYYAVKINNSTVLRMSRDFINIRIMFYDIFPMLIAVFVFLIIAGFLSAKVITKKFIKPINRMLLSLDDIDRQDRYTDIYVYEEFEPLLNKIKEQKLKIREYIQVLKYERDTISIITENMKEGFILLNKDEKILSINSSGKRMTGNTNFKFTINKNIIELTRNPSLLNNIKTAIQENKHIIYDIEEGSHHYRYYFSPVTENNSLVLGLLILIEDITAQKNAEIMRREFSANVSHELKTPLTTMIGFAEIIKEGLVTDLGSIKKYCSMINKEGLRLISLIEDIMRLSRIEEGVGLESTMIDLNNLAYEVCELLQSKAYSRNIELSVDAENIIMAANKNYISELLYNLVDNGIKYNKNPGKVSIKIYKINENIFIVVEDTGVGIPKEHVDRIFERFYRVDKSRSKDTGGTGLGLSIVKHITEIYKGSITIDSKVNQGTVITVKFPVNNKKY